MTSFFDSFDSPKSPASQLPARTAQNSSGMPASSHSHTSFQPNYGFYLIAGLLLLVATLLLYFLAHWSLGRIFWGTFLPITLGIVTYRYIEPPYRDARARQVASILGFGFMGLLLIIYHLLLPLLSSNHPVHLYLLALITALGLVTWFLYREQQLYRAIGTGLVGVFLLIGTLSFWHLWSGKFPDTATGDSWTKYSVFGKRESAATRPISPPVRDYSTQVTDTNFPEQPKNRTTSVSTINKKTELTEQEPSPSRTRQGFPRPEIQSFDDERKIIQLTMDGNHTVTKKVGEVFFWEGYHWVVSPRGIVHVIPAPAPKVHPKTISFDHLSKRATLLNQRGESISKRAGEVFSWHREEWIVNHAGEIHQIFIVNHPNAKQKPKIDSFDWANAQAQVTIPNGHQKSVQVGEPIFWIGRYWIVDVDGIVRQVTSPVKPTH